MYAFQFIFFSLLSVIYTYNVNVKVQQGKIIGMSSRTLFYEKLYFAFYGVPYAEVPVGKLRFKDPKWVKKWERTLDATVEFHGACAQEHIVHKSNIYGSEDCLYLNIYTPQLPDNGMSQSNLKPVIVWIHGYAFTNSFSHVHGPDFLIENDIVVVTLTHRLGAIGFIKLDKSDTHANMGLKDIVMGLRWINKNIQFFGGDKNKITLSGSGSACFYISLLLVTKYKALFSKIILQSGSIFSPSMFQGNETYEKIMLEKELIKIGYKNILETPTKDIIKASRKIYNAKDMLNFQRPVIPFSPVTEIKSNKSLLIHSPAEIYTRIKMETVNKAILIGYNSQEGISEIIPFIHNPRYLNLLLTGSFKFMLPFADGCKYQYLSETLKEIGAKIKHHYIKKANEHSIYDFLKLTSDLQKYPIHKFINSQLGNQKNKIFVYNFNYVGKLNVVKATSMETTKLKIKGAAQGDEICYLFKCEPLGSTYVKLKQNPDDKDTIFIKEISQMWTNFIKYSDPNLNKQNSTKWLRMTSNEDFIFRFDSSNVLTNSKNEQKMLKFWDDVYEQYFAKTKCNKVRDEL